jgi:uncharacterized membrane protein YcaP (DUF421 family)
VVAFLLAEVVGSAATGADDSLSGGLVSLVTLLVLNLIVNRLVLHSAVASRIIQGRPEAVIRDGELAEGALRKLRISPSELDHAIRSQHGDDVSEVDHAELTPSGKLVLTLKRDEQSSTKADIDSLSRQRDELRAILDRSK